MAILDGNIRQIAGTSIDVSNLFVGCWRPKVHVLSPLMVRLDITYDVYETPAKWLEDEANNKLKIEGLVSRNFTATYNRSLDGDIFEFIDIKTKEDLLLAFPESDPDLITFVPPHAE